MLAQADERHSPLADVPGAAAPLELGSVVHGRYRLEERIGSGGMGIVYRAEHIALAASFAIKVLRPELLIEAGMVERLLLEARAAARIVSDYVVPIVDAGVLDSGVPFLVMPLLLGEDLRALLARSERLPPVRAVNLGLDACRGLAAAHARGLVHRDLKPANLFVTRAEDGADRLKLLDFGVVKQVGHETTRPGGLVGTVRYMAPEQMGLDAPIGPTTDVFALGVILYRCLSGDVPFAGDTTERIIFKTMTSDADPLSQRCSGLPDGLSEVIGRALAKHPADRFPSADAFADALLPFAGSRRPRASPEPVAALDATRAEGAHDGGAPGSAPDTSFRLRSRNVLPALGGVLIGAGLTFALGARELQPATELSRPAPLTCAPAAAPLAALRVTPTPAPAQTSAAPAAPITAALAAMPLAPESGESASSPLPASEASASAEPPRVEVANAAAATAPRAPSSDAARGNSASATAHRKRSDPSRASADAPRPPPSPFFDPENPYAPRPRR